jgi:hypothetical protein
MIQEEAIWTLTKMAAEPGALALCGYLLDRNFASIIMKHLNTSNIGFLEYIVWFLGSSASDFPNHRDRLLDEGIAGGLINILDKF